MKKNILGMNMTEWKHLSGLADPYKLALAEAGVEAGVPPVVESKPEVAEDDDGDDAGVPREIQVAQAAAVKKQRMDAIKRAARNLRGKTRNAAEKAATTPAKDRYKAHLELAKHRKTFVKGESIDDLDPEILWAVYLEDIGSSAEEFGKLLDIAIESDDEEMTIELLGVEDQLDEILGAIGAGLAGAGRAVGQGAMAVGRTAAKGALAVGKGVVKGAQAAGGALKQGFKAGMSGGDKPAAGGGAPAGATPPAGAPPAAPAGASPQAAAAAPAAAATPATADPSTAAAAKPAAGAGGSQVSGGAGPAPAAAAPAADPNKTKKPGLLGTLGRGIGKVAKGVAGMGAATAGIAGKVAKGVGQVAQGAQAGYKEDVEEWEEFIAEEFGMTGEQYVEMFDKAIEEDDQDILGNAHQIDEIFAAWRAKRDAAASEKQAKVKAGYAAAKAVVAKHGVEKVKQYSRHGYQPPTSADKPKVVAAAGSGTSIHAKKAESTEDIANQIMESSGYTPRAKPSTIKDLMGDQLRFSGYTDDHISKRG